MTVFWIVATLFLAGALLLMLPALWARRAAGASLAQTNAALHRDQLRETEQDLAAGLMSPERFEQARLEIQHRVLEDTAVDEIAAAPPARRTALALALLIPLASVVTYLQLGRPEATAPQVARVAEGARHAVSPEQIQQMVTALAERLKVQPGDREGWLMLGRSYVALSRFRDAALALRRAAELGPPEASLLADLADVTGMSQGKRLAGEPARLIQQALDLDPRHVKALALAGSVAFEAKDYGAARGYWQRLVEVVPAESPMARSIRNSMAEATQLESGLRPVADRAAPTAAAASAPAAAATAISGRVQIAPELAARIGPGDTLFVFARAAQGPRMPLAILRSPADGKGLDFKLDDSMAMAPNLRLSGFAQVVIGARVSRTGQATPQPGDLVGQSSPVAPGATAVQVVIDRVQD